MIPRELKLGPSGYTGIAVLGTAGTSMELAPFKNTDWAIWACSPAAYPICAKNRSDVWFEPHRWLPTPAGQLGAAGTKPWFSAEFHDFLAKHTGPVFMTEHTPSIPTSVPIPYDALCAKYGHYYWTSTIAYMIAMAIEVLQPRAAAGEKVYIGLWGVDMAATEEYAYQRPACQHFIGLAMSVGIHVVLPQESDLMRPPTRYGVGEHSHRHIRYLARRAEVNAQVETLKAQINALTQKMLMCQGMLSEIDYTLGSWTDDVNYDPREAVSFASQFGKSVGGLLREDPDTTGAEVLDLRETDARH